MTLSIRTDSHRFPTPGPEADGTLRWDATTAVTVTVSDGTHRGSGWTYSHPAACAVVDTILSDVLKQADPSEPVRCWQAMIDACRNVGATGLVTEAISAVDIALWDLLARRHDLPLVRLWGCRPRSVPVYGSGGFVNLDDDELRDQIHHWSRIGCRAMKIKIGQDRGARVDRDLARVRTLVDEAPSDVECMVDANGGYSRGQALRVGRELDRLGIAWFEEPVTGDDLDGLASLRDALSCDVAAGEYTWRVTDAARTAAAVDCLQLDVTRCGGYTGWFRCAAVAAGRHLDVSAHCAPALSLPVAAATGARHIEYFVDHARLEPQLADGVPAVDDGMLQPASSSGHGLILRE